MNDPDEKTRKAFEALQRIANGRKTPGNPIDTPLAPLRMHDIVTLARETCDELGLPYDRASVAKLVPDK